MRKAMYHTPVVTAFEEDGSLDVQGNKNVYDYLIEGGVDGIVLLGSTGEFFSMTMEQKKELIQIAADHIDKRVKLLIGTSCMRVDETIELSNFALASGADAVMIIGPYYFSLSDQSIEAFYDAVASEVKGDIYLYNFPDRTGYDLSAEITLNLLRKHENIVGYKDTVTEVGHTRDLITKIIPEFPDFDILAGFDESMSRIALSGGGGCIGGLSNLYPEICSGYTRAINENDLDSLKVYQAKIDSLMDIYKIGNPFIPIVKKAMIMRGVAIKDVSTQPFLSATDLQTERIRLLLDKVDNM